MARRFHSLFMCALLVTACESSAPQENAAATKKTEPTKVEPVAAKQIEPTKAEPTKPEPTKPEPPEPAPALSTGTCDEKQAAISKEADERAKPYDIAEHLAKNFPDMKVSWLMKESPYQNFVVKTAAKNFGRCDDTGCYLFAAPTAVIEKAVNDSMKDGKHDPAVIGQVLGLPATNFEGPLRMMTLDLDDDAPGACARLPVDADPGVWKCKSEADTDCFKFGGYTSGNVPEIMVINAPVEKAVVKEIP
jgi:hypothetical protein